MKKVLIATGIAALAFVSVASAQGTMFNTNLTVGSTGPDVVALQNTLISKGYSIPAIVSGAAAKGYFGTQTKTAVMAYQAARGIPATGFVGPLTRGSLNSGGVVTNPGTPSMVVCPVGYQCMPVGGGSAPVTGTNGLSGGVGDITVTERTSGTMDEVVEGSDDVKVLGFEVDADGSDVALSSVRVEFKHSGNGSDRLNRYVEKVSVMLGNTVVGSSDVSSFSESSDVYSRNIPLNNAIVRDNSTGRFSIAVSSVSNIDSDDLGTDWEVAIGQIRFQDATGIVLTDTTGDGIDGDISETFSFEDLGTSGDIRLRVSEDSSAVNEAHVVPVDDTSDTNDVKILSFTLDAQGSDIDVNSITFEVTSANGGGGVTEIANDFRLMKGSEEVGSVTIDKDCDGGDDGFASTTDTAICVVVDDLDDDNVSINEDSKASFTLVADINDVDGGFINGTTLSASLDSDDIDADDENGDTIEASDLTGSADSTDIQFLSSGIAVKVTSTPDAVLIQDPNASSANKGEYTIVFDVYAVEDTAWVELTAASSTDAAGDDLGVAYNMESASTDVAVATGTNSAILSRVSGGSVTGNFVRIDAGQHATLSLKVTFDPATAGSYRVQMTEVGFNQNSAADADQAQVLSPGADYQSAGRSI